MGWPGCRRPDRRRDHGADLRNPLPQVLQANRDPGGRPVHPCGIDSTGLSGGIAELHGESCRSGALAPGVRSCRGLADLGLRPEEPCAGGYRSAVLCAMQNPRGSGPTRRWARSSRGRPDRFAPVAGIGRSLPAPGPWRAGPARIALASCTLRRQKAPRGKQAGPPRVRDESLLSGSAMLTPARERSSCRASVAILHARRRGVNRARAEEGWRSR